MKFFTRILLVLMLATAAVNTHAKTNPTAKVYSNETQDRHLSGFSGVNVAGPFDVVITQGSSESVKVDAPAEMMNKILTEVNGGVLKVYAKSDIANWGNWFGNHKKIVVYVTAKDLNAITISGSGDVAFKDGINAGAMRLKISGSGDMIGKLDAKTVEVSISGSGDMKLVGHAESATVSLVGSGDYTARNFETASTYIRLSGSGDAYVHASEKLDAALHGSGDIHCSGSPKNVSKSKSGSGDISVN